MIGGENKLGLIRLPSILSAKICHFQQVPPLLGPRLKMPSDIPSNANESSSNNSPTFASLGVIPELCEACEKLNYKHPTPIQAASIPEALNGRDIIGLAETGSGKTAAFAIPILQALMEKPSPLFACVLVPTRELAFQITAQFEALGAGIGVKVATITGGMDNMT